MPRTEQLLVVFVASPADLEPERNRLEEVIRELNIAWSRTLGLRLELVRWETHGYPGLAEDAQAVLNQELPGDYDIFVGLMWGRYGTATGRAGSGTEEEFARALARFRTDPQSVKIMFYFKDAPLPPSSIDPEQLARVQTFRASLGVEGALYWTFVELDEFERLARLHLTRQIQELTSGHPPRPNGLPAPSSTPALDSEEDLGLLDLLDLAEEHFTVLTEITGRIAAETSQLGAKMRERTEEINRAAAESPGQLGRRDARTVIEKAAVDMDQYVARMRTELPLHREALQKGTDAVTRAAMMQADFGSNDRRQLQDAKVGLSALADALGGAHDAAATFRATIQAMPRMTVALNRAKRDTVKVVGEVLESLSAGRKVLVEAIKAIDVLLGQGTGDV
jgi:hypothetical protein